MSTAVLSKNVIKTEDKEVEILIPCSGDKYRSDKNFKEQILWVKVKI